VVINSAQNNQPAGAPVAREGGVARAGGVGKEARGGEGDEGVKNDPRDSPPPPPPLRRIKPSVEIPESI